MSSPERRLYHPEVCCEFEPFQAAFLLELLGNAAPAAAGKWVEVEQAVRFRTNILLSFPPSLIAQIVPPLAAPPDDPAAFTPTSAALRGRYKRKPVPQVVWNFFGLFGPHGTLPLTYTETLLHLATDSDATVRQTTVRTAFRDWLDIFNHRAATLLYRGWQKYRMPVGFTKSRWKTPAGGRPPDKITQVLYGLVGLGTRPLRGRVRVDPPPPAAGPLVTFDDAALLKYAGTLARRRAGAYELEAMLADYFRLRRVNPATHRAEDVPLPVRVLPMTGQWLTLPPEAQTVLGAPGSGQLGTNAVAGERVWDFGSKFRIRIGPLTRAEFETFLPDQTPTPANKAAFVLSQLVRLYVGPDLDFDIQLVLMKEHVPDCELGDGGGMLGWNSWAKNDLLPHDVDDVIFDGPCEPVLG